jgi:hypothetical protein
VFQPASCAVAPKSSPPDPRLALDALASAPPVGTFRVGQPVNFAASVSVVPVWCVSVLSWLDPLATESRSTGEGQPVNATSSSILLWRPNFSIRRNAFSAFKLIAPPADILGEGHPVKPLPDVRRTDTASWQYGRPDGVTNSLQVIAYSVEPPVGNRAINLLANNDWRGADGDETKKSGP